MGRQDVGPATSTKPSGNWSERAYQQLPAAASPTCGDAGSGCGLYFKLWPNVAFDIYPDQVDFMQFLPVSPTETLIREIAYAMPDDRREMKAARYLNWRINRQVNAEDTALVARVQAGMASQSFSVGPLGDSEVCLQATSRARSAASSPRRGSCIRRRRGGRSAEFRTYAACGRRANQPKARMPG